MSLVTLIIVAPRRRSSHRLVIFIHASPSGPNSFFRLKVCEPSCSAAPKTRHLGLLLPNTFQWCIYLFWDLLLPLDARGPWPLNSERRWYRTQKQPLHLYLKMTQQLMPSWHGFRRTYAFVARVSRHVACKLMPSWHGFRRTYALGARVQMIWC